MVNLSKDERASFTRIGKKLLRECYLTSEAIKIFEEDRKFVRTYIQLDDELVKRRQYEGLEFTLAAYEIFCGDKKLSSKEFMRQLSHPTVDLSQAIIQFAIQESDFKKNSYKLESRLLKDYFIPLYASSKCMLSYFHNCQSRALKCLSDRFKHLKNTTSSSFLEYAIQCNEIVRFDSNLFS